jgi:hypothetical protein
LRDLWAGNELAVGPAFDEAALHKVLDGGPERTAAHAEFRNQGVLGREFVSRHQGAAGNALDKRIFYMECGRTKFAIGPHEAMVALGLFAVQIGQNTGTGLPVPANRA